MLGFFIVSMEQATIKKVNDLSLLIEKRKENLKVIERYLLIASDLSSEQREITLKSEGLGEDNFSFSISTSDFIDWMNNLKEARARVILEIKEELAAL